MFHDIGLFVTAQQHSVGGGQGAPGPPDLLVVRDRGPGSLEVDHEAEIRLVEAHPERRGGDQGLEIVVEQGLLQLGPLRSGLAGIRFDLDAASLKPLRNPLGVTHGQRVDDPVALDTGDVRREPGETLCLRGQANGLELERRPVQVATHHL